MADKKWSPDGFSDNKDDDNYWMNAVHDYWNEGNDTDEMELLEIVEFFDEWRKKYEQERLGSESLLTKSEHQKRVEEFMIKAGQVIPDKPTIPDENTRLLRARLTLEEALETIEALGFGIEIVGEQLFIDSGAMAAGELRLKSNKGWKEPNLEEIVDGCADLSVVNVGTLSACGVADVPILEEVDKANLRKFEIPKCDECGEEMVQEGGRDSPSYTCEDHTWKGAYGAYCREDGKWVKGPNWQPPDLKSRLKEQGWYG